MNQSNYKTFFSTNIRELGLIAVIIVLAIFVNIRSGGTFLTGENINDMFKEMAVLAIMSVGMMLVLLTGGIDLSAGAVMALAGMTGTTILKADNSLAPLVIILIAMGVGLLCGLVNGLLVSRLHIFPIIATLGMMYVYRGATYLVGGGGWVNQMDMSKDFLQVATGSVLGLNNLIVTALAVYILFYYFLNYTRRGRQIYAVGNSMESAKVSGIHGKNVLLLSYGLMGLLAGLGGILYVCRYATAQGATGHGFEMNLIAACVLGGVSISGGTGKVQGVLLGAILFGMLQNALPLLQVSQFWQEAIRGLIILVSVVINALVQRNVTKKALERRRV